jgi:vacuolar-type H+-ATPase subunit E/Vma4
MDKETVRKVFNVIMERVNSIASEPEFYNTLTQSCLSSLMGDLKRVITPKSSFDYRRLANGFSDELLYENGWIDSKLSFP